MDRMKCPDCGAKHFYVKDPEDQYSISEFSIETGKIEYFGEKNGSDYIPVLDTTEVFCDQCAWHDKFKKLKQVR